MDEPEAALKLLDICFRYSRERRVEMQRQGLKLAHYTSAENGLKILQGKKFWLRDAALMNDFSEIRHGQACMDYCGHKTDLWTRLISTLDQSCPGSSAKLNTMMNNNFSVAHSQTFLASFCEHHEHDELGQLSMWRAYGGGKAGVALVLNTEAFNRDTNTLGSFTSPVLYGDENVFEAELRKTVKLVEQNMSLLSFLSPETVGFTVFFALHSSILSTKHIGFNEEKEWRVLHAPTLLQSRFVVPSAETVGGISQIVYKFPLEDEPGLNFPEIELTRLVNKIIIGPSSYPVQVAQAYTTVLRDAGFINPESYIRISNIPLRHRD